MPLYVGLDVSQKTTAICAVCARPIRRPSLRAALDELPAAIYVTDAEGVITYFNPACIDFTGRRPEVGQDRWCVTWRLWHSATSWRTASVTRTLLNSSTPLPHDRAKARSGRRSPASAAFKAAT